MKLKRLRKKLTSEWGDPEEREEPKDVPWDSEEDEGWFTESTGPDSQTKQTRLVKKTGKDSDENSSTPDSKPRKFKLGKKKEAQPEKTTDKAGRGGKRVFSVHIGYDDHGTDISNLLMEAITSRNIIPTDWDEKKWSDYMHHTGQVPFYVLQGDPDRFHMCIYASELLRQRRDMRDAGIDKVVTPTHDLTVTQPEIDGTTWGETDEGPAVGDYGLTHSGRPIRPKTVRDQVNEAQKQKVEKHKSAVLAAQVANNEDPYILRWVQAEKLARIAPRSEWEGQLDFEFESMVKYCYGWLRDIGEVPQPYPINSIDLFWPRAKVLEQTEKAQYRRGYIVERVMKFWRKSVKNALAEKQPINLTTVSYRATLAAMKLEKLIESYATNYRNLADKQDGPTVKLKVPDEELETKIKRAATEYFKAHFPVALDGAKPGPITTSDPDYVEYIRLCRKYKLTEGMLLHEQGL